MPREIWSAPRLWPGERVAVLATGESLTPARVDFIRGKARVIAVNDAYKLAPWADVFFAADSTWWDVHYPAVGKLAGVLVGAQNSITYPRVNVMKHEPPGEQTKFDDPRVLWGNNSGAEAHHLAFHLNGGGPILSLGCDCVGRHFFGDHPAPLRNNSNYGNFAHGFALVAGELSKRGVEVLNCSPVSALTCFRKASLEDALA